MNRHANQIKTLGLLVALSALLLMIGHAVGGTQGMTTALVLSLLLSVGAYWFSDKIVLGMHGAKPLGPGDPWGVYETVDELSRRAGMTVPRVYLVPERLPNAFATGRDPAHAAVAVTQGILETLNPRELRAVLAHELSHVQNRDILVSTVVACLASAVMYLTHLLQWMGMFGSHRDSEGGHHGPHPLVMLLTVLLAPLAATLIQLAVSRTREFMADESGARLSQDPEALASALQKIADPQLLRSLAAEDPDAGVKAAFSPLYIHHAFSGENLLGLFSTHPPVRERVKRLKEIAADQNFQKP